MTNLVLFIPNSRTVARFKKMKEAEKQRLMNKIGINPADAPLYEEELKFLAYQESLKKD